MTLTEAAAQALLATHTLLNTLRTHHLLQGALGRPIQYGQKFSVTAHTGVRYQAILYVGKAGPRLVAEGPAWPVELWQIITTQVGSVAVPRPTAPLTDTLLQEAGSTVIYVDGSYLESDGRQTVGWAFEVWQHGQAVYQDAGSFDAGHAEGTRNIAGECAAVLAALTWCELTGIHAIECRHDYSGLARWARGSWQAHTPLTQHYASIVTRTPIQITWVKVDAHRGEPGNTRVDAAARQAATTRTPFMETPPFFPATLFSR
ncbi:MAG: RNase H family protein [Nitrospira sp.]